MSDSNKWKTKLLSSSLPLEYEVSRILANRGFSIDSDYSYTRKDSEAAKDFSVDIKATGLPFNKHEEAALLTLLVECKYRHRNNKWLFFDDPNIETNSLFFPGETIRAISCFSPRMVESRRTKDFDDLSKFCLKGTEIDLSTGAVHDSEIRHGLLQLQYAIPRLLHELINENLMDGISHNNPFFYCPILVTTSEIWCVKPDINIDRIENATNLEDIASKEPWIITYSEETPEFKRHRVETFQYLGDFSNHTDLYIIDDIKQNSYPNEELPSEIFYALSNDKHEQFRAYFSQTIICSLNHFDDMVEKIIASVCTSINADPSSLRFDFSYD